MNEGEGILVSHGRPARSSASHGLAWLALVVALPGLISGVSLFLYYLSNFGIDSLFNALQGRWLDIAWFVGLALSGCSCILGGVLVVLARRRGERVLPALWAFWLGTAGLLVPMVGILALIVAFLFWPGS